MNQEVTVHELSSQPTEFWRQWKDTATVMRLQVKPPSKPPAENKVIKLQAFKTLY